MNIFYLTWSFPLPHWLLYNMFYLKMVCRTIVFWEFGLNARKKVNLLNIFSLKWFFSASPLAVWQFLLFENCLSHDKCCGNVPSQRKTNSSWVPICQYLLFEHVISIVFWACDGNLWKIVSRSSIWKPDFRVFAGLWWELWEHNGNIFDLKTWFPVLLGV